MSQWCYNSAVIDEDDERCSKRATYRHLRCKKVNRSQSTDDRRRHQLISIIYQTDSAQRVVRDSHEISAVYGGRPRDLSRAWSDAIKDGRTERPPSSQERNDLMIRRSAGQLGLYNNVVVVVVAFSEIRLTRRQDSQR